jgi:hypothetical protein
MIGDTMIDEMGRLYFIMAETSIPELQGEAGILAFTKTQVTIYINDKPTYFFLKTKMPAKLYLNGKPVTKNVIYETYRDTDDGFFYGVYFNELSYKNGTMWGEDIKTRTMDARVVKCLRLSP